MSHRLQRYDEFKNILHDYQISAHSIELLSDMKYVITIGPTSSGRTSLISGLIETGAYERIISSTTRPKRSNNGVLETDGDPYWFKTEEEMLDDLKQGRMLEAEIVHGIQVSGVSIEALTKVHESGKIAITEMDYHGVLNVYKVKKDVEVLFVIPPSYEAWMERLKNRGIMTADEVRHRMSTAEALFETALESDYYKIMINDKLEDTVKHARRIVEDGVYSEAEHAAGRKLIKDLHSKVVEQLA